MTPVKKKLIVTKIQLLAAKPIYQYNIINRLTCQVLYVVWPPYITLCIILGLPT